MVESLTAKNLELEERVSDLRVAVSELEIAQELSEELEAQQAAEAQALRRDLERLSVQLSERDHALRQAEMRGGDQERAVARLRALAKELAAERDGLRGQVALGTTALGQARDRAQGVLGQVQALRAQAERLRAAGMAAARARIDAAAAGVRAARVLAWLPSGAVDREAAALEGELALGRLAGKVDVAWRQLSDGAASALALALGAGEGAAGSSSYYTRHAETPLERLDRAAHEGRVVVALGRAQRLAHVVLLRLRHPTAPLAPERGLAVAAETGALLGPVERAVDEVLTVLQEEGGVPEAHSPLAQLEERLAEAEGGLSLLRYEYEEGDGEAGAQATKALWAQATAHAQLRSAPLLALLLAAQAHTVAAEQGLLPPPAEAEEEGEDGESRTATVSAPEAVALLTRLAALARTEAPRHVGRCLAQAIGLEEYFDASASTATGALDPVLNATGRLADDYGVAAAALREALAPSSPACPGAQLQGALGALVAAWDAAMASLPSHAVPALEASEAGSGSEPREPLALGLLVGMEGAGEVRARLNEAVAMAPLLKTAREAERLLGQALRDKEREEEALRAQVGSLEGLLQRAAARDEAVGEAQEEAAWLLEEKERVSSVFVEMAHLLYCHYSFDPNIPALPPSLKQLEQETQVLSEALEAAQQQADALESENKRLRSLQGVTTTPTATSGPSNPRGPSAPMPTPQQPHPPSHDPQQQQQQQQDMPLVAAAALASMHRALRHAGREVGYWRAAATRQGLLHGLQPLAVSASPASLPLPSPPPEAAGRGAEAAEETRAQLRRALQGVNRLAARVHGARCAPRVVRLRLAEHKDDDEDEKKPVRVASAARDALVREHVEAAKLALEYRRLREGVEALMGVHRAAAADSVAASSGRASYIRKAPVLDVAGARGAAAAAPRLVGRVRMRCSFPVLGQSEQPGQQCIPVRVGEHHLRALASRFGVA